MKIVLAPDSFKESLSAQQVCAAMAEGVYRAYPSAEVVQVPMADGGEGRLDGTSAYGKVVAGIAEQAALRQVPTIVLAGGIGKDAHNILKKGVTAYFSICTGPMSLEEAQHDAAELIAKTAEQVVQLYIAAS